MFGKTPVLKFWQDSVKNVFGKVLLSNLSPITILKTNFIANNWLHRKCFLWVFLVRVTIFKIAMRASCGETTSKGACKISAFHNFVKNYITLSLVSFESSSYRDFKWEMRSKRYWCQITKGKNIEVHWIKMFLFFLKKIEKWNFCNTYAIADAVLIVTFRIMTFMT